mmetsp:Transcript_3327/g.12648  ORF Transcript_3327/g.12648 Transcript_3327/m.12648 type:complete len:203 (-) Transcript_3327:97-705(-)
MRRLFCVVFWRQCVGGRWWWSFLRWVLLLGWILQNCHVAQRKVNLPRRCCGRPRPPPPVGPCQCLVRRGCRHHVWETRSPGRLPRLLRPASIPPRLPPAHPPRPMMRCRPWLHPAHHHRHERRRRPWTPPHGHYSPRPRPPWLHPAHGGHHRFPQMLPMKDSAGNCLVALMVLFRLSLRVRPVFCFQRFASPESLCVPTLHC